MSWDAQYCHLLSGAASPNIRSANQRSSSKEGTVNRGQRVRTDRRAVVRGPGERGDLPGARVDEDREIVEIQHLDGDIEELDVDGWAELDLELTEEPEGWSGSKAEKDEEEDEGLGRRRLGRR
jgi:hypothetical protein